MRRVGIREFKDHATSFLASGETLVIERHGKPVGFYVPVEAKDRRPGRGALDRLDLTVDRVLTETGMAEDELAAEIVGPRRRRR